MRIELRGTSVTKHNGQCQLLHYEKLSSRIQVEVKKKSSRNRISWNLWQAAFRYSHRHGEDYSWSLILTLGET